MKKFCAVQIHRKNQWEDIARFTPDAGQIGLGYKGCGGSLEYCEEYVTNFFMSGESEYFPSISLPLPVDFYIPRYAAWPAFFLDLLPNGAGRQELVSRLHLKDTRADDWQLLLTGAKYPVGWLRVITDDFVDNTGVPLVGFTKDEVALRENKFLEYMIERGAAITGSSDVHGESPKLLLTEDCDGYLHADGALPDHLACKHWLVKFSRKRTDLERKILRNECAYLRLANHFGVTLHKVEEIALHMDKALFVPRFDRSCSAGVVTRYGMESFVSAAGIAEYGAPIKHEEMSKLILKYSTAGAIDLLEYVKRDVLNVCFGNTDNHGRNHAFLKYPNREARLSPLYDFAPMLLSDEGYARVIRWDKDKESTAQPIWSAVGKYVVGLEHGPTGKQMSDMFADIANKLCDIGKIYTDLGLEADVFGRLRDTINSNITTLELAAKEVATL